MWMTLLYIVTIAVVAVIVVAAVLYIVIFAVIGIAVLFGFKVAWKKRNFLERFIPDNEDGTHN